LASCHIRRTADDLSRVAVTYVDAADVQAVSVRMPFAGNNMAHYKSGRISNPKARHTLYLSARQSENRRDLVNRKAGIAELEQE
jgi:hypothetical protein